jgi:hypothetical protein
MPVPKFCSRTSPAPVNVWANGALLALGVGLGGSAAAAGGGVGCAVVGSGAAVVFAADGLGVGVGVAEARPPTTGTRAAGLLLGESDTFAAGCADDAFTCHEIVDATAATRPTSSSETATRTPVEFVSTHPRAPAGRPSGPAATPWSPAAATTPSPAGWAPDGWAPVVCPGRWPRRQDPLPMPAPVPADAPAPGSAPDLAESGTLGSVGAPRTGPWGCMPATRTPPRNQRFTV